MIALIDTCVILDSCLNREPFNKESNEILRLVASNRLIAAITAKSIMDIHYVLKKVINDEVKNREVISSIIELFYVLNTTGSAIEQGLGSTIKDYEDAVNEVTAKQYKVDYIVTRNIKDFKNSDIEVITPKELLKIVINN